ncbi:hypothetical protein KPC83_06865 [Collinsella sp. zg1085]|uniref:hypothetical protein n=1 Tax=Collinsella sp. zg1085 TaxID=2844380 RepID=UPI001C0E0AF9|nr:hypothetical protein [Collinsella sp. zg1085]QWT17546.1 hypothetical protein KPC83_06865 [Collinsella sp. zg1085]
MGLVDWLQTSRKGISRRGFAAGALASTAALAAITLTSCSEEEQKEEDSAPEVVTDASKIIDALEEFESADIGVSVANSWDIDLGTVLFHTGGTFAAALLAPESATHPNTLGVLSVSSGNLVTLLEDPTQGRGYSFYDLRCSEAVFAWIEIDYIKRSWVLLGQGFSSGELTGTPVVLDTGDSDWEPPRFTCSNQQVIWQKMPLATGSKRTETSTCYVWSVGASEGRAIWESRGRFATGPRVAAGLLTIVPRVRVDEGTYYGLSALDISGATPKRVDQLVLPASIRPFDAIYTGKQFIFSIEASYDSGGSLGKMGTYIGREGGPYVYFGREPVAQACFNGAHVMIKTQAAHYALDLDAQKLQGLSSADRSLHMGDFPASEGEEALPLVFATIRNEKGIPSHVRVRQFAL